MKNKLLYKLFTISNSNRKLITINGHVYVVNT